MSAIIPATGIKRPKVYTNITYPKKNNTDMAIHQKLRKKYVYETNIHKINNIIVDQTNAQLQEKVELDPPSRRSKQVDTLLDTWWL